MSSQADRLRRAESLFLAEPGGRWHLHDSWPSSRSTSFWKILWWQNYLFLDKVAGRNTPAHFTFRFWWSGRWWDFSPERNFAPFDFILTLLHFLMLQRHSFKINHLCVRRRHMEEAVEGAVWYLLLAYVLDWFIHQKHHGILRFFTSPNSHYCFFTEHYHYYNSHKQTD